MARVGPISLVTPCILGLAVGPAWAGDRAEIGFVGYSADSRYLAFEEFGVQDGSGFAYANLYIVDLDRDGWVAGSPFRVLEEHEGAGVSVARGHALAEAKGSLAALDVGVPVTIAALNSDGERGADRTRLRFGVPSPGDDAAGDYTLSLDKFPLAAPSDCRVVDGPVHGFALTLSGDGADRELHRDVSLPKSRGCALDYALYAVVLPAQATSLESAVAIVSSYPYGFEGPDRRFLAIPIGRK